MSLITATAYGPDNFGRRKGTYLFIPHTVEPTDPTKLYVRDALAVARWQTSVAGQGKGSYNYLIAIDGIVETVPWADISGGVNPFSTGFRPVDWAFSVAPEFAVRAPNDWGINVSLMGRVSWFEQNGYPPEMVRNAALLLIESERRAGRSLAIVGHMHLQPPPERFDPGLRADAIAHRSGKFIDLLLAEYKRLVELQETPESVMVLVPLSIFPAGTRVSFEAGVTYDLFRLTTAGQVERKKFTPPNATGAQGAGLFVLNGDTAHPSIRLLDGYYAGWHVSGWGPKPTVTFPPTTSSLQGQITDLKAQLGKINTAAKQLVELSKVA